jgi:uncharacterized membrane protein
VAQHTRAPTVLRALSGGRGHPSHAAIVTLPIGMWVASFLFDLGSKYADEPYVYGRGAFWLIILGLVAFVPTAITGVIDLWYSIERPSAAFRIGLMHAAINDTVALLFFISFLVRLGDSARETPTVLLVLSAFALAALTVGGLLGGELVFRRAVRVASDDPDVPVVDAPR